MSDTRDALRKVAAEHHVGALIVALDEVGGRVKLPQSTKDLISKAYEFLLAIGLAERSSVWDDDLERRAVWWSGSMAKPNRLPVEIDALADSCVARSGDWADEHQLVQWLLASHVDDPGLLIEVIGVLSRRLASS